MFTRGRCKEFRSKALPHHKAGTLEQGVPKKGPEFWRTVHILSCYVKHDLQARSKTLLSALDLVGKLGTPQAHQVGPVTNCSGDVQNVRGDPREHLSHLPAAL